MVFSSIFFLFSFLPIFLVAYHLVSKRYKNIVLLLFSLVFYAWGAPKFIFILLFALIINYFLVLEMSKEYSKKKLFMLLSLCLNIGLLAYFKYANFFVDNVNSILNLFQVRNIEWVKVALPIGISFLTFQSITYTVDVYRGVNKPLNKIGDYLLYILMFPPLIAGPIIRYNTIAADIVDREKNETFDNKVYGVFLFIIGLSKKVLIANVLGQYVDNSLDGSLSEISSGVLWLVIIAYSFQIYFDFSGYSDMAIGLGRVIGFKFPENFNNPYISQSITEFWRRWHITLGEWMKDYLYIPLGGNRVKSVHRLYLNLIVVFLISGFWHGASWNFVIWGAWHGMFLIFDRLFLVKLLKNTGIFFRILLNYLIVVVGWVFFRIEELSDALLYIKRMFSFEGMLHIEALDKEFVFTLLIAILFSFIAIFPFGEKAQNTLYSKRNSLKGHLVQLVLASIFLIVCAAYIISSDFNPFIYFRF